MDIRFGGCMKAVKLVSPKNLVITESEKPAPDGKSAIIMVTSCGICGSDIHYWETGLGMNNQTGLIMGHEFAGVLEDPGDRKDIKPGDRVVVIPLNPCGECASCRQGNLQMCLESPKRNNVGLNSPGGYAEYVSVRSDMVRKLPDTISDLEAALIEPASVSFHAVRLADIKAGDKVLIIGSGAIGLFCAAWARISGAARIFIAEVNDARAEAAARLGEADEVVDAKDPKFVSKIKKATSGGVDIAIDASGAAAGIDSAISALKMKGTLVLAGVSLKPQQLATVTIIGKELTLKGSLGYSVEEFEMVIDFAARKALALKKYVSQTVGFDKVQEACTILHSAKTGDVKIVIKP